MKDQVGTVYQVFDETTRVKSSMNYDTFGNLVNQAGSTKGHLAFQGKYYDSETGLYYFYHRYYNPTLGRFMTEDPIGFGGGLNMYGFVGNNPVMLIDPHGLVTGRASVTEHYMSKNEFNEKFGVIDKWGVLLPSPNSGIAGNCTQLKNGKWYPKFTLNFSFDIYIVNSYTNGTKRSINDIHVTRKHELDHYYDLTQGFDELYSYLFDLETDYENGGYSSKCKCDKSVAVTIVQANHALSFLSLMSATYRDFIIFLYYDLRLL